MRILANALGNLGNALGDLGESRQALAYLQPLDSLARLSCGE